MIRNCTDRDCCREFHHHGPHADTCAPLERTWWNEHNLWPGHNTLLCAECGAEEDREVTRLQAGGALRPNQADPPWRKSGIAPPRKRFTGAFTQVGQRWLGSRLNAR